MFAKILLPVVAVAVALFLVPSDALAWGCSRSCSGSNSFGGSFSHSSSSSGGYGGYSHSGSGSYTGRDGNTYDTSHSSAGYGGFYGGGGFHSASVSGPDGSAYAAGVYRRY